MTAPHLLHSLSVGRFLRVVLAFRRRRAFSMFCLQFLSAAVACSGRSVTSFGFMADQNVPFRPLGLTIGTAPFGKTEMAVVAQEQPSVHMYHLLANDRITSAAALSTQNLYRNIDAADLNGDGVSEYVALHAHGNGLSILRRTSPVGYRFEEMEILLKRPAERCIVVDLNNDKRKDVLLFGKTSSGVATLLGQSNGTFKEGALLFPDISVSDAASADINADGVADIIVLNWLSNQLTVFYGISRLVFTEQVAVELPSEPSRIAVTRVSAEKTFHVAVTLPEAREVQVYSGNSLGDYRLSRTFAFDQLPAGIQFADINGDGFPDLVAGSSQGIHVALSNGATTLSSAVPFGIGNSIRRWLCSDIDMDGHTDCVLIDENSSRLVALFNSQKSSKGEMVEYAVGSMPGGLAIGDFGGSGKLDIAVANSASSTLSILINRGQGRFDGQVAIPTPENPTSIASVATSTSSGRTLIASHAGEDRVTVVNLDNDNVPSESFSVSTGIEPHVLLAHHNGDRIKFLVRYKSGKEGSYLLSLFEQIHSRQFVERSLRPTLPTRITALTVDEDANTGGYELLFATNDKRITTIYNAVSREQMEFGPAKRLLSFGDSTASTRLIMTGFINDDSFKDGIVALGPPRNEMGVWYGSPTTILKDSLQWIRDVLPAGHDNVIIEDVNNDRQTDIAWLDAPRKSVMVLYGTGRRGFRQPAIVAHAEGIKSIRIAPLRTLDELDLVMSHGDRGTISVIANPFSR